MRKLMLALLCILGACAVGQDYKRPMAEVPQAYKESLQWKQAEPQDAIPRGTWWVIFNDPALNALEEQIDVSNQNVKIAQAQFRQARALVEQSRANFFPTVSANLSQNRGTGAGTISKTSNHYNASLDTSWELDVWGRIRRTVESSEASAEASATDLTAAKLSAQAELAINYLNLRAADEQKRLLDSTVEAYAKSLKLIQNMYNSGVQARSDVLQAQVQLESTQAQALNIGVQRAQFEHAIAILLGKAPANFSIAPVAGLPKLPVIPVNLPSALLERRPDIAGAERRVAAANTNIGIAEAAFFPDILLSASGGFDSTSFAHWFSLPNRMWSVGPSLVETLFDAGLRGAKTEAAIAAYDQAVATYRQAVLSGFQEVEDNLAALRILQEEAVIRDKTVADAKASTAIITNQYKAGTVSYLNVVTAQTAELNNELAALTVQTQRLTAAATLIKALGGGWDGTASGAMPAAAAPKDSVHP